jgi:hypothetical protein
MMKSTQTLVGMGPSYTKEKFPKIFLFGGAGDETQGLTHGTHALQHWPYTPHYRNVFIM